MLREQTMDNMTLHLKIAKDNRQSISRAQIFKRPHRKIGACLCCLRVRGLK